MQFQSDDGSIPKSLGDVPYGKAYDFCKKEYDACFRQIAMMGYGMVFISHEQSKTVKTEKGEEYSKIMPTLPDRPRLIVNRMVDIIGYLREVRMEDNSVKRMMFMRDNLMFEAGSRFKYLANKIELNYESLVNAIHEAIDKQISIEGGAATDEFVNSYIDKNARPFEEVMNEARELWKGLLEKDPAIITVLSSKIEEIFGRKMKLSEATPNQVDLVELMISEMKNL